MRGAAGVLLRRGAIVTGSDQSDSASLQLLRDRGAAVAVCQDAANIPDNCDAVVHSAAVKETNPEMAAARQRGLRVMKYSELLGLLMADRAGVAVAGTHGKSTTTAMVAFVMKQAGLDPSFVIGADVKQLDGSSGVGDGRHFVVEACEYDRSFLNLRPRLATILNVERDHLDYYRDLDEIIEAFGDFAALVPQDGLIVVNGEDRNALKAVEDAEARVETFGLGDGVEWRAEEIAAHRGCMRFHVSRGGKRLTETSLSIPGRHNMLNALAATAVCVAAGVEPEKVAELLGRFNGAHRRLTLCGEVNGVTVVDDYAHHPTEIQVTLKAARRYYEPRKMYVVFQPHQHSRTRFLLEEFARSFGEADVVIMPEIYFVRDSEAERDLISARHLVQQIHQYGGEARHEKSFDAIVEQLSEEVRPGDLVVTMGAGDVWKIAERLVKSLSRASG